MTLTRGAPTLFDTIHMAISCDDIGQACYIIQTMLGVRNGGLATLHFPELNDPADDGRTRWHNLSPQGRLDRITDYIVAELNVLDYAADSRTLHIHGFKRLQLSTDRTALTHHVPQGGVWRITTKDGASAPCRGDSIRVNHIDEDGETVLFAAEFDWQSFNPDALVARIAATYGPLALG
ncbi:hypothetical protein [Loktanella sp. R86503]|uniref:hypothetical protein n=1 Tax=Loktanella sp. R86503 TaxID=3093847 RepID=UPI0036DDCB64